MFRKKRLGIQPKAPRSLDEINKDYNDHAVKAGHLQRVVHEINSEIRDHVQAMLAINQEAKLIPPPTEPAAAQNESA